MRTENVSLVVVPVFASVIANASIAIAPFFAHGAPRILAVSGLATSVCVAVALLYSARKCLLTSALTIGSFDFLYYGSPRFAFGVDQLCHLQVLVIIGATSLGACAFKLWHAARDARPAQQMWCRYAPDKTIRDI